MVTLTVSPSAGLTATLGKSTLDLTTGFDSTTLALSASAVGTYTVTVTGMSGTLSHTTAIITLVVTTPDFTITASPTSLTISIGGTGSSTITIAPLGGFNGVVNLVATVNSTLLTATLSPTSVTMSGTSNLSVTSNTAGAYLVTVTGTSGTITHSTTVTVTVQGVQIAQPSFIQSNWKQKLSLAKYNFQQTWRTGIMNNDNATTIYAQIVVNAVDGDGSTPFTETSSVITLGPRQSINNVLLTHSFTSADIGRSFTFQLSIVWGTSPTALTNTSTLGPGVRTTGSFTVYA